MNPNNPYTPQNIQPSSPGPNQNYVPISAKLPEKPTGRKSQKNLSEAFYLLLPSWSQRQFSQSC